MTALAAWTLLETGESTKSPPVQNAAAVLRMDCRTLTNTYGLSLAIIFFDRLGDPADRSLIQALGVRLLSGQNRDGGWFYVSSLAEAHEEQLRQFLANGPAKQVPADVKPQLPIELRRLLNGNKPRPRANDDNSNTQFAMFALWVARRHGVPVESALEAVEARFRRCQHDAGSWGYAYISGMPKDPNKLNAPRPSMTCAGLLGLALGHGARLERSGKAAAPHDDSAAKIGLRALESVLAKPAAQVPAGLQFYFLFSLERMAVVYSLKKVGDVDWYTAGARILLERQEKDGSWLGDHGLADTCFALLFLRRANVAHDLTFDLKAIRKPR